MSPQHGNPGAHIGQREKVGHDAHVHLHLIQARHQSEEFLMGRKRQCDDDMVDVSALHPVGCLVQRAKHRMAIQQLPEFAWIVIEETNHLQAHPSTLCQERGHAASDFARAHDKDALLAETPGSAYLKGEAGRQPQKQHAHHIQHDKVEEEQA